MSELPEGIPAATEPVARDSSSGIVLRRADDGGWEALLGLRSRRSRFMPSHLSFPGGGLEPRDRPDQSGAFERCATRELDEETGIHVEPTDWRAAGVRTTPPMFPVRFRTQFFIAVLNDLELPCSLPSPDEIEQLRFVRAAELVAEWDRGLVQIPPPVLPILRTLAGSDAESVETLTGRVRAANDLEQRCPRIEFTPEMWMLPVRTPTLPPATHTNVWMPGVERFAIVDPGSTDATENRRLLDVIARRIAADARADSVVLTHHHRDHVGGAGFIARELGLPVRAHPETIVLLQSTASAVKDLPEITPLEDGAELQLGDRVLRAHHTPGHAPGHLALEIVGSGGCLAGDLLSGLSTILIHPTEGDMEQYLASLERLRALSCQRLYPGHGPPLPARALDRLIEHRHKREGKIMAQLSHRAATLSEIAAVAYDDVLQVPPALIEGQTLAHLIALERRGSARALDAGRRSWVAG